MLHEPDQQQDYEDALEHWNERYAEAGFSFVCGGGDPLDAAIHAAEMAGPKPSRSEYGLPEEDVFVWQTPSWVPADDDVPF